MTMRFLLLASICFVYPLIGLSSTAYSSDGDDSEFSKYFYFGTGIGSTHLDPGDDISGYLMSDDKDSGIKLFVGQRFSPSWSWEASYLSAGEAGLGNIDLPVEAVNSEAAISYDIPAVFARYHPFKSDRVFDPYLKVGGSSIISDASLEEISYEAKSRFKLAYGVGVDWSFTDNWFARVEFDHYDSDARFFGLAIGYQHDRSERAKKREDSAFNIRSYPPIDQEVEWVTERVTKQEAEQVTEVDPEPIIVTIPSAVKPAQYSPAVCSKLEGRQNDVTFKEDSKVLTDLAKQALIEIADYLKNYPDLKVSISAHTDSLGDDQYNERLSFCRAKSVSVFLFNQGIARDRLSSTGFGERYPIASNATVDGRALNRRVELEVINRVVCL